MCSYDSDDSLIKKSLLGWRPGPGNLSHEIVKTCPYFDVPHREPKMKYVFSVSTRRLAKAVEGLNTSLTQSAGELWSCKVGSKSSPNGT